MNKITQTQIDGWKKQHGEIIQYTIDDKEAYFRKPTRQEMSYAAVSSNQMKDAIKYTEVLMRSCFLGGDIEILEKDEYFLGAAPVIDALTEVKSGEIKKL